MIGLIFFLNFKGTLSVVGTETDPCKEASLYELNSNVECILHRASGTASGTFTVTCYYCEDNIGYDFAPGSNYNNPAKGSASSEGTTVCKNRNAIVGVFYCPNTIRSCLTAMGYTVGTHECFTEGNVVCQSNDLYICQLGADGYYDLNFLQSCHGGCTSGADHCTTCPFPTSVDCFEVQEVISVQNAYNSGDCQPIDLALCMSNFQSRDCSYPSIYNCDTQEELNIITLEAQYGRCTGLELANCEDEFYGGPTCTDTDGGANPDVFGTVSGQGIATATDFCYSSTQVREFYCEGDIGKVTTITCGSGKTCIDGACITQTQTCTDSDGGQVFNVKGTTSKGVTSVVDSCSGNVLTEYYCTSADLITNTQYTCPTGQTCSNGACVAQTACTLSKAVEFGSNYINGLQGVILQQAVNAGNAYLTGGNC